MKVALVINELDIMGGTHKQLVRLCQYLENKNVEFTIFTKKYLPEKTYSELTSYNIVCLKTKKKSRFINSGIIGRVLSQYEESKALSKLISDEYDIINVHDNGLLSLIKKMKKKEKLLFGKLMICLGNLEWEMQKVLKFDIDG